MTSQQTEQLTCTILSGASQSSRVDLFGFTLVGIIMPAAWDAAVLTFLGAGEQNAPVVGTGMSDNTVFQPITDQAGVELSFAGAVAGRQMSFSPLLLQGVRFLKLRSGNIATPVNQTANRTILLVTAAEPT